MKWFALPVKVSVLMILAAALAASAGYFTYQSLSSIVATVKVKSRPDLRLLIIRDIAADLDRAESSVRLYRLTGKRQDIQPYYQIITEIDDKIDSLRSASYNDTALLAQIDTISNLTEENMLIWNEMIDLYHSDSLETYIHSLTAKIAIGNLNKKKSSILKRVFSRKALKEEEQKTLISDINKIGQQDSIKNSLLLATESKLAITGNEIRERLYFLITRMETEVVNSIRANSESANKLAEETYKRLIMFAVLGALLVFTVLIVVVRYVRKIREYQKALEASREETEKMAKTRERFVATMSHEIRTPVNAIFGFAGQLMHESLNERSLKMLGIIRSTSEHLVRIVNDILDFSKLSHDAIVLDRTHFLLEPLFEEVRMLFASHVQSNNTRLFYTISAETPPAVYGDSYRLKQILYNLVGNAVKFTLNGEIRISVESANFSGDTFELTLAVSDTGIGISKEMQDKVFDEFTQAEAGISRKFGGTGLGLSIVKKLVDLHQGTVKLESREGKGTTITCTLPYQAGKLKLVRENAETFAIPEFVKKLKILVVDDEEYNRLLFRTIFKRWQLLSDEVGDGSGALEKIKSSKYDLVFMDARMPGIDGLEASSRIRSGLGINDSSLPIIGTSATHSADDLKLYHSFGINAFLPKPFTERMLLDTILSVIQKDRISAEEKEIAEIPAVASHAESGTNIPVAGFNLSNLYHLANNDVSFVRQLLNSFIQSTEEGLLGLREAIKINDLKSVNEIAHRISSPCRHVGANQLYSKLKMIEEQAKSPENISILADMSSDLNTEFLEVKKGLQHHLENI